ncbi:AlpA family phage regulatory protein [Vibrio sp. CUB2]|uniref:helix-turn-helix transcriptional regulator n=1 Tax=Vibrio sp. CUB2 TaxID=2315233 RepID=UPI00076AC234|nr:AlpA family phage regulatory protein [Vibrio sp. CUB2]
MFTKLQIAKKLSVSKGTISNLPNFPNKIESDFMGNTTLYRKQEVNAWLLSMINKRGYQYSGDIDNERIVRMNELSLHLKRSKSHIYEQVNKGALPPLVTIGNRASGFLLSEVNAELCNCGLNSISL